MPEQVQDGEKLSWGKYTNIGYKHKPYPLQHPLDSSMNEQEIARRQFCKKGALFVPALFTILHGLDDREEETEAAPGLPYFTQPFAGPPAIGNGLLNNLRAYFKFDETSPPPWVDSTSHAWTSTSNNGVSATSTAILGPRSISCTGGVGSFVNFPSIDNDPAWTGSADGNSGTASGSDFTVQAWVLMTGATFAFASIFANLNSGATTGGWWLSLDGTGASPRWGIRNSASVTMVNSTVITNAQWHLLIAGFDHTLFTHGGMWLSLDGGTKTTFDPSGTNTTGALHGTVATFGNYTDNPNIGYAGLIDEAALWIPRSLSQANITTLWNGGAGTPFSSFTN